MSNADSKQPNVETDDRFPSGEWTGFYLQRPNLNLRRLMELSLTFRDGQIEGGGSDIIGEFTMKGRYSTSDGKVTIDKHYVGQHHVAYTGAAEEGKGIWGIWQIRKNRGGWHIWPVGMDDPTQARTAVEAEAPVEIEATAAAQSTAAR